MRYAVACSSSHARVQEFLSFARFWEGVHYFPGGPLANFYGNLYKLNVVFKGVEGPEPLSSFGSAHASSLKFSSHTFVFFTLC